MKRELIAKVISIEMAKTIVVETERKFRHPFYGKVITRHKKLKAHNENIELGVGDMVQIQETRPLSKDKHFLVVKRVSKAKSTLVSSPDTVKEKKVEKKEEDVKSQMSKVKITDKKLKVPKK